MAAGSRRWWRLRGGDLGWGDYGDVLVHGLVWNLDRTADGCVQLERTGPFVPPVTVPSDTLLLTAEARGELEKAGLGSFEFRPVVLARVVNLAWHEWDLTSEDPVKYPAGGEPENYVLRRKDSEAARCGLPEIFELVVADMHGASDPVGRPIVRDDVGSILVDATMQSWMAERWSRWVEFEPWVA